MAGGINRCPWRLLSLVLSTVLIVCHGTAQAGVQDAVNGIRPKKTTTPPQAVTVATVVTQASVTGYHMNVTSTGLAALDSTVFFQAWLVPEPAHLDSNGTASDRFMYEWTNTANRKQFTTWAGLESNLSVIFSSQDVAAGEHLMTVAAYKKDDQTTIVAFKTLKFKLTQELNGLLTITQTLNYQRHPHIFSTKTLLTLTADVHDLFLQSDLTFDYYWFKGEGILAQTKQPNCLTTIHTPANTSLASFICVRDNNSGQLRAQNRSHISLESTFDDPLQALSDDPLQALSDDPLQALSDDPLQALSGMFREKLMPGAGGRVSPCVTSGIFEQETIFKDPVQSCHLHRVDVDPKDRGINIKRSALVNITCRGSTPSSACITVTGVNSSLPYSHICQPQSFVDQLSHLVRIHLTSTGWNDVHFFVYNDVSRHHVVESFYGYDPDSVNVPALTIPLVFGVMGLAIMVMAGVYVVHHRQKPRVEVADFDFHPTLTSSQLHHGFQLARMATTIRSLFFPDRHATEHKHPLLRRPATDFGNDDSSEQFYESL